MNAAAAVIRNPVTERTFGLNGMRLAIKPSGASRKCPSRALSIYLSIFPFMNASTISLASSSGNWVIGCFMKYADGEVSAPPTPLSRAILQQRMASITTPCAVRGIFYRQSHLKMNRDISECPSLHPEKTYFIVPEPRHVIRRADMDVFIGQRYVHL